MQGYAQEDFRKIAGAVLVRLERIARRIDLQDADIRLYPDRDVKNSFSFRLRSNSSEIENKKMDKVAQRLLSKFDPCFVLHPC